MISYLYQMNYTFYNSNTFLWAENTKAARCHSIASVLQNRDCLHFQIQPEAAEFEKLPFTFFRYVCYIYVFR